MHRYALVFALLSTPTLAQDVSRREYDNLLQSHDRLTSQYEQLVERLNSLEVELTAPPVQGMDCPSACRSNCCAVKKLWTARGGAVAMRRDDGPQALNNLDTAVGPYVSLARHTCCCDLEALFFQLNGWSSTTMVTPQDRVEYSSQMSNFEFNLKRPLSPNWKWLAGFRWIDFGDQLEFPDAGTSADFGNQLYGGQLGLEAGLWRRNCLSIEALYKIGMFQNSRSLTLSNSDVGTSGGFAWVTDLWVTAVYQIAPRLALRGGYQLIYLNGLGTANTIFGGSGNLEQDAFAHGFHGLLELKF